MDGVDEENHHVVQRPGSEHRCRRVGIQRCDGVRRSKKSSGSSILSSTTFLLGLSSIASMMCPVAAASLDQSMHSNRIVGNKSRRERRERGERNKRCKKMGKTLKKKKILHQRSRSDQKFFDSLTDHPSYSVEPGQDSLETIKAKSYNPSLYVPGTLILPEYSIDEKVWLYCPLGWFRGTVKDHSFATTTGLYEIKPLNPEKVGTCNLFLGGPQVLRRNDGVVLPDDDEIKETKNPEDPLKCDDNWWWNFFNSFRERSTTMDRDFLKTPKP